ncbi:MAG: elongation factor P [Tenericutes bacterium GWC2_34_14]|nr:MAG: elongation factor P [Tenericutes bacterium GWA2_35_7]OHE28508.1 MAG: elongation factor P [Tenericutes bacterium GWC2_34_14]OHE33584.1 MAG: elongation factor P [Tenericutes bacterium GWE2_34_108]OHE36869.1 MAG: elongation factor P [Tenericutes bacterium GWF1_35_14]OHE38051.1 MAG: elongation factor P [Tenericutes bacterium GWF2_35_184]OHE43432.1 MAG: elongation factor P [Tenericutes bacterium RIFOXYA2_FULL_36_32]OHE46440.1 MAG: elongation factor P [Tenericutes bacterium RIFOXYA12_FULL_3
MISTNDFKTGQTILYEGNIYSVIEFMHVKPGKGGAFVRTKLRNLRSGSITDVTFNAGTKVERAQIDKTMMQYLYADGNNHVFMNTESYEQIEISKAQIEHELNYLYEGLSVEVMFYNSSEILGVLLPDKLVLEVTETMPAVKGDTKGNAMKDAILQTGVMVKVPMFIEQGEKIIVNTNDGSYVSRDK